MQHSPFCVLLSQRIDIPVCLEWLSTVLQLIARLSPLISQLLTPLPPQLSKAHQVALSTISYIGCSISIFCLAITLVTFAILSWVLTSADVCHMFSLAGCFPETPTVRLLGGDGVWPTVKTSLFLTQENWSTMQNYSAFRKSDLVSVAIQTSDVEYFDILRAFLALVFHVNSQEP